jgi:hypothetical protein
MGATQGLGARNAGRVSVGDNWCEIERITGHGGDLP